MINLILATILIGMGIVSLRAYWNGNLKRKSDKAEKFLEMKGVFSEEKQPEFLPLEEECSEETSEAGGIPSSAVMDEEDEEYD